LLAVCLLGPANVPKVATRSELGLLRRQAAPFVLSREQVQVQLEFLIQFALADITLEQTCKAV
jgi:hypothetical protein